MTDSVVDTGDPTHFRTVLGHFATGVVVVTATTPDGEVGITCQSFSSVSLDPPLVLFCAGRSSFAWSRIRRTGHFCVNILAADQEEVCRTFAGRGPDKFRGVGWRPGVTGAPVLDDVLGWVDCTVETFFDAGDHDIVVGRVTDLGTVRDGGPLLYYRGGFGRLEE